MTRGLDSNFITYGISGSDLAVIADICRNNGIDPEWLKDFILKPYHQKKTDNPEVEEKNIKKIIEDALKNIPKTQNL